MIQKLRESTVIEDAVLIAKINEIIDKVNDLEKAAKKDVYIGEKSNLYDLSAWPRKKR